ncbi:MAG TPA: type II toxin-antitoxin system RelB/DinJ family antitoxin [Candidatus Rifleibacterium sp.]|nr:type II toxin-antitoxin system RelB/DinJ family antitoxin [Candidatus Rifleibacterium sp.]HPT47037.1 type II toxin-antitoxin system RelB/DinJ family antitoxin [Candidatus Rifleibacterium sp.]
MSKSAIVQARVEPALKAEVERVLREIGLSTTEAITIFFNRIRLEQGIPFELKIPNAETRKVFQDTDAGKNLHGPFNSHAEMMAALEDGEDA